MAQFRYHSFLRRDEKPYIKNGHIREGETQSEKESKKERNKVRKTRKEKKARKKERKKERKNKEREIYRNKGGKNKEIK